MLGACSRRRGSGRNRTSLEKLTPFLSFLRLPVFVFLQREIITFFPLPSSPGMLSLFLFLFFQFFSLCVRTLGIVSVPAYVIHYIIIYRILITDSVGAGAKPQKQRNTSSTLITVTDRLPACTKKA